MKPPSNSKDCRTFTGMLQFFSQSIPKLSVIYGPINQLTGKREYKWTEKTQNAFEQAKTALQNAVCLAFPSNKPEDTFVLTSDASDIGWGGTLAQLKSNENKEVPLGFVSGTWHDAELRWPIAEKELCSFVKCLQHFDVYLYGRPFIWRCDNRSLSYMLTETIIKRQAMKSLTPKMARYIDYIGTFDFSIELCSGTSEEMASADYLS